MAAQYTEITLDDMERFLKRAYRALRPRQGKDRREIYYDLNLSDDKIFIRVWTSIPSDRGTGAAVGQDAIRVTMVTAGGKPLVKKQTIVKRTQGWKGNLQDRIDTLLEDYESKTGYWKDKQQSRDEEATQQPREAPPPPPSPSTGGPITGRFAKYRDAWVAKIPVAGSPGLPVILENQAGKRTPVTLTQRYWKGQDKYSGEYVELWGFNRPGGNRYSGEDYVDLDTALASESLYAN